MTTQQVYLETILDAFFGENAYLVYEHAGGACWIIDPGFGPQPQQIAESVRRHELKPSAILVTHCHGDHIAGIDPVLEHWPDLQIMVPEAEAQALQDPIANFSALFGTEIKVAASATRLLKPSDTIVLQESQWRVLDCSGHSPGGIGLYCEQAKVVLTGDALFADSIGRTDLPGSSEQRLLENIRRNLLSLPDDTIVYPGHGPSTTIGQERVANPFVRANG